MSHNLPIIKRTVYANLSKRIVQDPSSTTCHRRGKKLINILQRVWFGRCASKGQLAQLRLLGPVATYYHVSSLRDEDSGVVVPHKVDVGRREVLADHHPPVVAGFVVPPQPIVELVVQQGHAGLVAPAVGLQGAIGLSLSGRAGGAPVVVLKGQQIRT